MQPNPPEPEREPLQVPISADLKRALKVEAAVRGTTMAALVEQALQAFLGHQ